MAQVAQSAVLVSCAAGATAEANATLPHIKGPTGPFTGNLVETTACYANMGFQASHFGEACRLAREMSTPQPPSKLFMVRDGAFVEIDDNGNVVGDKKTPASTSVLPESSSAESTQPAVGGLGADGEASASEVGARRVFPTLFCGMTANLFGTGCREALRFLVQHGVEPRRAPGMPSTTTTTTTTTTAPAAGPAPAINTATNSEDAFPLLPEKTHLQAFLETEIGAFEPAVGGDVHAVIFSPPPLSPYKSFLSAIVTSGGGIEHDIRRACEEYQLTQYSSEACAYGAAGGPRGPISSSATFSRADGGRFGNVEYGSLGENLESSRSINGSSTLTEPSSTRRHNSSSIIGGSGVWPGVSDIPPPPPGTSLFTVVMQRFARRLMQRQASRFRVAQSLPIPDAYVDTCTWAITPSEVWCLAGLWLPTLIFESLCALRGPDGPRHSVTRLQHPVAEGAERMDATVRGEHEELRLRYEAEARARAESTVVYWAACQEVPIFSPSFVDGDVMPFLLEEAERLQREQEAGLHPQQPSQVSSASSGVVSEPSASQQQQQQQPCASPSPAMSLLKVDLVRDIYYLNKMAMTSKFTGMIICGGGVVKHHICNANLMRNGADLSIFLNNGQEFDGSDGGAKPEEAISWGKIRIDGQSVKVYSEVSAVFPLLVASAFVPAVRDRQPL